MSGIILKRNVILRAIVNDALKEELKEELQRAADEIDHRIQQIDFSTKPYLTELQRTNLQQAIQVRRQIEAEKRKQQEMRDALMQRKKEIEELEPGTEVIRGTLEGYVEVKEGDNLAEVLSGVEIVTKDNIVQEIRQHKFDEQGEAKQAPQIITDINALRER